MGVNYLLKAVWVQLCLVYYLNCHLWRREKKKHVETELNGTWQQKRGVKKGEVECDAEIR